MARIAVPVRPVDGGHQAVCETADCTQGLASGPWRSEVHVVKVGAEDEARTHRQWHRYQRPVPTSAEAEDESVAVLASRAARPAGTAIADALPGLTWHVTKPLKQAGIVTLADLAARTDEQLLDLPSFGERRLAALKAALTEARS